MKEFTITGILLFLLYALFAPSQPPQASPAPVVSQPSPARAAADEELRRLRTANVELESALAAKHAELEEANHKAQQVGKTLPAPPRPAPPLTYRPTYGQVYSQQQAACGPNGCSPAPARGAILPWRRR